MSQSQGVGSPSAVEYVAGALLSGSQSRGVGGRKRTRRDSSGPTRKSARGQKPRRSEKVLELYQMGFSEDVVDDAIRRFPSNVGLAATWLLESQGGVTATARETAAPSSTQKKPPASSAIDPDSAAQPVVHASGARQEPSQSEDGAASATQFDLFDDLTVPATSCASPRPPAKGPLAAPASPVAVASSTQGATGSRGRSRKRSRTTEGAPSSRSASTSRRTRSMGPKSQESGLRSPPPAPEASEAAFEPVDSVGTGGMASRVQQGGGGTSAGEAHRVSPGEGVFTLPPAGREELAPDPVPSLVGAVEGSEALRMTHTEGSCDAQEDVDKRRTGASVLLEQAGVQQEERRTHAAHAACVGAEKLPAHGASVEALEQSQLRREVQRKGLLGAQAGTNEGLRVVMEPYPQHVEKERSPAVKQVPAARTAAAVAAPGVCVDFPASPSCASPTAEHSSPGDLGSDEEKRSGGLVLQADTEDPAAATQLSVQSPCDDAVTFDYFLSQLSQADQTSDEVSQPCKAKEGLTTTALSSEKENLDTAGRPVVATPSTAAAKGLQFTDTGARGLRRTSQSWAHEEYIPTSPRATPDGRSDTFHEDRPPAILSSVACSGKSWWAVSGETPSPVDAAGEEPMRSEKRARTCGGTTEIEDALWPYDELQTPGSRAGACGDAERHNSEGMRPSPCGSGYWGKRSSSPTVVHVGNEDGSMPSAEGLRGSADRDFVQGSITRGQDVLRSEDPPYLAGPRYTEPSFSSSIPRTQESSVPLASAVQGLIGHGHTAPAARGRTSGLGRATAGKSAEAEHMHWSGPRGDDVAANAGSTFGSSASSFSAPRRAGHGDAPFVDACDGDKAIISGELHGPQLQVEQQRATEGPIGFSTGTGRRVAVSAASMARINHLFEPRGTEGRSACLPSSGGLRRVSYNGRSGPVTALHSHVSRPQQKATLGLQQTKPNTNRAEVVALRADTALSKFEPVQVALPDQPVTTRVRQYPPALGPEHSLLRAVQRPARKGGTSAAVIEGNHGDARAAAEALRDLQFSNTNGAIRFSTGRGQPVAVSAASLARVRHLFEPAADATTSATGRLRQPSITTTRQSLAQRGPVPQPSSLDGQGEEMPATESDVRCQGTVSSEDSDGTCQSALVTTAAPAGSPLCPVAEPASDHSAALPWDGDLQASRSTAAYVSVGFCTGSGRPVAVSEGSMARVSHLFEPTDRDSSGGPGGGHSSLSAIPNHGQDMVRKASRAYQKQSPSSQLHGQAARYHHTRQGTSPPGAAMTESGAARVDEMSGTIPCAASSTAVDHNPRRALEVQSPLGGGESAAADAAASRDLVDLGVDTRSTSVSPPDLSDGDGAQQLQSAVPGCGVSFSTGSGRRVAVSAASLARVSHMFEPQEEAKARRGLAAVLPQKSNGLVSRRPLYAGVGKQRHSTDAGHEVSSASSSSVAVAVGHIPSGAAHAEEGGTGMEVAHPGGLAAGHSVDLGRTCASVAPPVGDSTAGAPEVFAQRASASSGNAVISFSTGRGRAIAVSEASMARVSHLFEPTGRDSNCGPGGGHRSLSAIPNHGQDMVRKALQAQQQQPPSSQLHGQAARYHHTRQCTSRPGAAMTESGAARVDEMSATIPCAASSRTGDDGPHRALEVQSPLGGGVSAAADEASRDLVDAAVDTRSTSVSPPDLSDGAQQLQSAVPGCGVSFSTGSGRRVAVSAASLARVSHMFETQEEAKARRGLAAVLPQKSNALVSRRPPSAAGGRQRHSTDAGHEVSSASSSSVAVAVGHIPSGAAHAEEGGTGMEVAHPGGLTAGHSVDLGRTCASVAPPVGDSTAGAPEVFAQRASASSGNAVFSFSTGRGRAIAVSEASMARVSHLFDSQQASSRSSTADAVGMPRPSTFPHAAASVSGPAPTEPAKCQLSDDASARGAQWQPTSCSAQSGGTTTGQCQPAVTDWSESVSPTAALFESDSMSQRTASTNAAIGPPMIPPSTQESVDTGGGVSFSTGGGRRVAVSEASIARVRHLFEPSVREVSMAPLEPIASFAGPVVIQKLPPAHQQLPEDEGQGRGPVADDMSRQFQGTVGDAQVDELMPGRRQDAVSGGESTILQLPPRGGGSTAAVTAHSAGGPITSMARVNHLFEPREVHQTDGSSPTPVTVHNKSAARNGGNPTLTAPEVATASAASPGVLMFEVVNEGPPLPFAGFSTGRGRQLTVSEESMAKTRHLFDEHEKLDEQEKPCGTQVETGRLCPGADQLPEGTTETGDLSPSAPAPVTAESEGPSWADGAGGASCVTAVDRSIGADGGAQEAPLAEPSGQADTVVSSLCDGDEQPPHFFSSDDEDLLQALEAYEAGLAHGRPSEVVAGNTERHICDITTVESMDVEQPAPVRANDAQPPDTLVHELAPSSRPNVHTTASAADSTTDTASGPASRPRDLDLGELLADLKQERLRLQDLGPRPCDELNTIRQYVCPVVMAITSDNAHRLRFDAQGLPACLEDVEASNPTVDHLVLPPEILNRLVAGVMDGKEGRKPPVGKWFANHYRLIVLKLACLERAFPQKLGGRYLTEARVATQLLYRYDREVAGGARPAVRLVCNGDAPATRLMILCVSKVYPPLLTTPDGEPIPVASAQSEAEADKVPPLPPATVIDAPDEAERPQAVATVRLELTDGWYCIDAVLDEALSALAARGRIRVGVKLTVCNASLQNASGGIEPLEIKADDPESRPYLRIHYNATRLTRWHARLGFQRCTNLQLPVSGLLAGGGIVSCIHAVVMRRYETKYLERRPRGKDGSMVIRILSQAEEDLAQAEYEAACQTALEKLSDEMLQEYEKRVAQGGGEAMLQEQHRLQWQEQMDEARRKVLDDPALHRESSPFFRVRICAVKSLGRALHPDWQFYRLEHVRANVAVLSVWNITDALVDALQEGAYVALYSLGAPAPRDKASVSSTLRLNASSSTRVQLLSRPASQPLLRYCRFEPRQITSSIRLLRHMFDPGLGPFVCRDFDCVASLVSFYEWEVPKHKHKTGHRDRPRDDEDGNDKAPYVTRFFFLDQSRCILCVERRDYGQPAANTMPAVGGIFLLTDLAFESYDLKTDTVLARMSPNSTMRRVSQSDARRSSFSLGSSSQGCPAYARGTMQHFCDWFSSADAAAVRAREEERLSSLLRDVSCLKSDKNAESPASAGTARRAQVYDYRERLIGLLRLEETKASIESRTLSLEVNVIGAGARRVVCDTMQSLKALAGGLWQGLPEYMRSSLLETNILRELVESEPPQQSSRTVATATNARTGQEQPHWPGASLAAQMVTWAEGLLCTQTFEVLVQRFQSECSQEDVYEMIELRVLHTLDE